MFLWVLRALSEICLPGVKELHHYKKKQRLNIETYLIKTIICYVTSAKNIENKSKNSANIRTVLFFLEYVGTQDSSHHTYFNPA